MSDAFYEIAADSSAEPPDLVLRLHVQPGAGRTAVMGRHGDSLKVKVGAPPEGGRANAAVVSLIAGELGVKEAQVTIESGGTSRTKRLRVAGLEAEEMDRRLELSLAGARPPGRGR